MRLTRLTDTSLIVHWFTEEAGVVKTVAKGALRRGSPFAGKLDLFFSGEIVSVPPRKGELHILKELQIHEWRQGLRRNYATTLMAGYFCQLVGGAMDLGQVDRGVYNLLIRGLDHLDKESPSRRAMFYFEKSLAEHLGLGGVRAEVLLHLQEHIGQLPSSREALLKLLSKDR